MNSYEPPSYEEVESTFQAMGGQVSAALVVTTAVAVGTWIVALTQTSRSLRKYVNEFRFRAGDTQLKAVTLPPEAGSGEAKP